MRSNVNRNFENIYIRYVRVREVFTPFLTNTYIIIRKKLSLNCNIISRRLTVIPGKWLATSTGVPYSACRGLNNCSIKLALAYLEVTICAKFIHLYIRSTPAFEKCSNHKCLSLIRFVVLNNSFVF